MANCPSILNLKKQKGITLIEVLIVLVFVVFLAVAFLVYLNPAVQMGKARDARRKSDLSKIKNVLEDYYNDKKSYPLGLDELVPDYLGSVPRDPATHNSYFYQRPDEKTYCIYTKLEYEKDPLISKVGCQNGCGPACAYNYGVCSLNVNLESCYLGSEPGSEPPVGGCVGTIWGCTSTGVCQAIDLEQYSCPQVFCNDNSCGGGCVPSKLCSLK